MSVRVRLSKYCAFAPFCGDEMLEAEGVRLAIRKSLAEKVIVCRTKGGQTMKILLVGNPNSGKSTLFNALTGGHARTGNWHGVTVGMQSRYADLCGLRAEICDLPGIYSLRSYSMEEAVSRGAIRGGEYDFVACIADALTLARSPLAH